MEEIPKTKKCYKKQLKKNYLERLSSWQELEKGPHSGLYILGSLRTQNTNKWLGALLKHNTIVIGFIITIFKQSFELSHCLLSMSIFTVVS